MDIDHRTAQDWTCVDPEHRQRFVRGLLVRPGRAIVRYRGYGHQPRVPEHGGFLIAPGPHGAFLDPFVIGLGQPRALRFMAKHQVFGWPLIGRLAAWAGAFPVVRGEGKSAAALEVATAVVRSGDGIVVFPEGRMVLEHAGLGTPRNGIARLALATGAPVVPVAFVGAKRARAYGTHWWWRRRRVTVVWGEPLAFACADAPDAARIEAVREAIWSEVIRLHDIALKIGAVPRRPKAWPVPTRADVGVALPAADGVLDAAGAWGARLDPAASGDGGAS